MISVNSFNYAFNTITIPIINTPLSKVVEVAKQALVQLAIAFAANLAVSAVLGAFFTPPVVNVLLLSLPVIFLTLAVIKVANHYFGGCSILNSWAEAISGTIARSAIVTALTLKLNHCIHEFGHAVAAWLTYNNANPKIFFNANGGATTYSISYGLTNFGKWLGEHRAMLFVTAAGLILPVLTALAEFGIAYGLYDTAPVISDILIAHGLSQLAETIIYGLYRFPSYNLDLENDFFRLWHMGDIHPFFPLALMITLPLAQYALVYAIRALKQEI